MKMSELYMATYTWSPGRGGAAHKPNEVLIGRGNHHVKRGRLTESQQTIRDPNDGGNRHCQIYVEG